MMEVRGLSKRYGKKDVVKDVSFTVPKQKLTALIGPNGAGKSTVLSIMSRLLTQDGGQVLLDEKELTQWKKDELAKKIAILKQSNHLTMKLTVRELVTFGRFPYSKGRTTKEDETYIDQAIHYMNLEDIQHNYLDELSGGQRQRAFIAMVIAQDTEYVLLDEPLNNLDMKHAVQIMKVLRRLVDELGKTVIIVIHDINFASCYADYIVSLKDGMLVTKGTTEQFMTTENLKRVYDMDMAIHKHNHKHICVYYT